ncbi:MAG: Hsp20/alpha crystallin family protein [Candidatus Dojkabacteria bacterium]|nr:MAG: Hsp20/alpha crystallin family protein [Candidatus Dojkabacteria bacterium]
MSRIAVWNPWKGVPRDFWDWDVDFQSYDDVQMDIYEDKDNVVVKVKAPGFSKDDLKIQIESNMITVSGSVQEENEEDNKDKKFYRKEIRSLSFSRASDLPVAVNADKAEATFKDGILQVTLPKREEVKPKSIEVKVG